MEIDQKPKPIDANGFRVLDEAGPDVLLDFLDWSGGKDATVVARVRVQASMLGRLRVSLSEAASDLTAKDGFMAAPITFQRGVFQSFRATTRIHLGPIGKDINQDETLDFDGSQCQYNGETFSMTQLRAAILAKWFVPEIDMDTIYVPQPAGVQVRPAQNAANERGEAFTIETATEDSNVVGSLDQTRMAREAALRQDNDPRSVQARQQERAAASAGYVVPKRIAPVVNDDDMPWMASSEEDTSDVVAAVAASLAAEDFSEDAAMQAATQTYLLALAKAKAKKAGQVVQQAPVRAQAPVAAPRPVAAPVQRQAAVQAPAKPTGPVMASNSAKPFKAKVVLGDEDEAAAGSDARAIGRALPKAQKSFTVGSVADMDAEIARLDNPNGVAAPQKVNRTAGARVMRDNEDLPDALPIQPTNRTTLITEGTAMTARKGMASGDVENAISSDELSELVPDAIQATAPKATTGGFKNSSVEKWDKTRPIMVRINDAINNHSDNPTNLALILAQESPNVAAQIKAAAGL